MEIHHKFYLNTFNRVGISYTVSEFPTDILLYILINSLFPLL